MKLRWLVDSGSCYDLVNRSDLNAGQVEYRVRQKADPDGDSQRADYRV